MLFERLLKFGAVGILNTLIDFSIFNILSSKRYKLGKIKANLISTTCAMIFSFFANQRFVFQASGNPWLQAVEFYVVTAIGLYVIQNIVIHLVTTKITFIPGIALRVAGLLGLRKRLGDDFIVRNTAKLTATAFSLTWNFILFQYVVFN